MNTSTIVTLLIIILIGMYLRMEWLVILSAVVLVILALISLGDRKTVTVQQAPSGGKKQDVIYPIIYEDVGEPPLLYPEFMKVKIRPHWQDYSSSLWEFGFEGLGKLGKMGIHLLGGTRPKKKKKD